MQLLNTSAGTGSMNMTIRFTIAYIVNTYGDMLYKLAMSQLNNASDAYDAVQDVMLKIHTSPPACVYGNDSEHVKAWLLRAVINRCRDYNRTAKCHETVELCEIYGYSREEGDYDLQEALANLPQKYRETLYLHYYEGYKISEIAKILKCGESGIKKRLVKGREMLRAKLEGGGK